MVKAMKQILLIEKNGDIKECKVKNYSDDELYKKCKFKNNNHFSKLASWKVKHFDFTQVEVWGKKEGRANQENKYDFPPPIDNDLLFGACAIVAKDEENNIYDINEEQWEKIYEKLFGGFEDLAATAQEDENEIDELELVPDAMKTKTGYLKDDFVVEDDDDENESDSQEQPSSGSMSSDSQAEMETSSELSMDEYAYSDED